MHPAMGSHVSVTHISSTSHGKVGKLNTKGVSLNGLKMYLQTLKIIQASTGFTFKWQRITLNVHPLCLKGKTLSCSGHLK
jgi:hypothetical protein